MCWHLHCGASCLHRLLFKRSRQIAVFGLAGGCCQYGDLAGCQHDRLIDRSFAPGVFQTRAAIEDQLALGVVDSVGHKVPMTFKLKLGIGLAVGQ